MNDEITTIADQLADQIPELTPEQMRLPFEPKRSDMGDWVYDHRVGIYATLIFYLLVAIGFVVTKITIEVERQDSSITIDLQQLAELERQRDELKKSVEELQRETAAEITKVENAISNEGATTSESITGNQDIDDLLNEARAKQEQMEANRRAYEDGLAEAQAIRDNYRPATQSRPQSEPKEEQSYLGKRVGNVAVSYILINPIRHAQRLVVPAYTCEGGGEVTISIVVNQSGDVVSAKVKSGGDACMQESALNSALGSRFDINKSAPLRQNGTITYLFVPQ